MGVPIDKYLIARACRRLAKDHQWEFLAIRDNEGCTPDDERFFQIIDTLMFYISDELKWAEKEREYVEKIKTAQEMVK